MKKAVAILLAAVMAGSVPSGPAVQAQSQVSSAPAAAAGNVTAGTAAADEDTDYYQYSQTYSFLPSGNETIPLTSDMLTSTTGAAALVEEFEGKTGVLKMETAEEETAATWEFSVEKSGLYRIRIDYYALENRASDVIFGLQINGKTPFFGCDELSVSKVWQYDTYETGTFRTDRSGNESRPTPVQLAGWQTAYLTDNQGLTNDPYAFAFFEGEQSLTLTGEMTDIYVAGIELCPIPTLPTYAETSYALDHTAAPDTEPVFIEAEHPVRQSHSSIIPMYDRTSAATSPSHPTQIRYNTIGSYNWQSQGEWITWEFDIEQAGIYQIGMRVRQNFQRGYDTNRRIYIDGEIPFEELALVEFPYDGDWYVQVLGNEEPFSFYLEEGRHTITMEVIPGRTCEIYHTLKESVSHLNTIYRKIIMVTGTTPDIYRDYYLEREIPTLEQELKEERDRLAATYQRLQNTYGGRDGDTATLDRLIVQLDSFLEDFETIPGRVSSFNDNISALSSWMVRLKDQPLEMDYIEIVPEAAEFRQANTGLWESISYFWNQFIGSFLVDYNTVGEGGEAALNVWVGLGRDQVQIIKDLVDSVFLPEHDFNVTIRLAKDSMIQATYAGTGPDVALFVGPDQPVNLAVRGALEDLTQFADYEEVAARFSPQASVPYEYDGGVYALPITGTFNMLFYRSDIFEELGLTPPNTWEEFDALIPILQRRNMNVGLPRVVMDGTGLSPSASSVFDTLLLQKGMTYFTEDRRQTRFDTPEALDAFKQWTEYYTKYNVPKDFDFYNRFRTGEMPIGIETYSMYNKLAVGAPEIAGNWEMVQIPGTVREDGTIDRTTTVNGTSAIIFAGKGKAENAWEFLKWFTSAEIQADYGRTVEALLGAASRYDTANLEALRLLPWTNAQQKQLLGQWESVQGIPQVPASYYISRNLYNAFRRVTLSNDNPREMLYTYNNEINREIERKRIEFGLD